MIEWIDVSDSQRIVAMAYDLESETVYVRFPNGIEWFYAQCPLVVWEEFQTSSKGRYIRDVLDHRPNGRHG